MSKSFMRSREEDQELQMSTKKVKESHHGKSIQSHSHGSGEWDYIIQRNNCWGVLTSII